jgi:hypothetical protein
MKLLHASALVVLSALASAAAGREASSPKADELYPPVKSATVVHAFGLPDDVKADVVRKALAELSTPGADCGIRYGPMSSAARPQKAFVIVEAPASVDVKDVVKALKKGASTVEPLAWTCFESADKTLGRGLGGGMPGYSPRDFILGISNDLRWVEARGGFGEFFFVPGKMDAAFIQDRFHKLAQPFGVGDVGTVVTETITWPLAAPIDPAAAKRIEKDIAKIAGVKAVKLDVEKHVLEVKVALDGLARGGPPIALPGGNDLAGGAAEPAANPPPRMRFDTNSLFTVLDKALVSVVSAPKESAVPGGK